MNHQIHSSCLHCIKPIILCSMFTCKQLNQPINRPSSALKREKLNENVQTSDTIKRYKRNECITSKHQVDPRYRDAATNSGAWICNARNYSRNRFRYSQTKAKDPIIQRKTNVLAFSSIFSWCCPNCPTDTKPRQDDAAFTVPLVREALGRLFNVRDCRSSILARVM